MCNWLGPQGLKERFKERREIESKLTDSGGKMKGRKRRKGKR